MLPSTPISSGCRPLSQDRMLGRIPSWGRPGLARLGSPSSSTRGWPLSQAASARPSARRATATSHHRASQSCHPCRRQGKLRGVFHGPATSRACPIRGRSATPQSLAHRHLPSGSRPCLIFCDGMALSPNVDRWSWEHSGREGRTERALSPPYTSQETPAAKPRFLRSSSAVCRGSV